MIIKLNNGTPIKIDKIDLPLLSGNAWAIDGGGYVFRTRYNGRKEKKTVHMREALHRLCFAK